MWCIKDPTCSSDGGTERVNERGRKRSSWNVREKAEAGKRQDEKALDRTCSFWQFANFDICITLRYDSHHNFHVKLLFSLRTCVDYCDEAEKVERLYRENQSHKNTSNMQQTCCLNSSRVRKAAGNQRQSNSMKPQGFSKDTLRVPNSMKKNMSNRLFTTDPIKWIWEQICKIMD